MKHHLWHRYFRTHSVLWESAAAHKVEKLLALACEAFCPVRHNTLSLSGPKGVVCQIWGLSYFIFSWKWISAFIKISIISIYIIISSNFCFKGRQLLSILNFIWDTESYGTTVVNQGTNLSLCSVSVCVCMVRGAVSDRWNYYSLPKYVLHTTCMILVMNHGINLLSTQFVAEMIRILYPARTNFYTTLSNKKRNEL